MAYTVPTTRSTGDLITATIWNTDIVDNLKAGVPDVFTTAGDTVYATGNDAAARLGIGSAWQVLRTNGGASAPVWAKEHVYDAASRTAGNVTTTSTDWVDITDMVVCPAVFNGGDALVLFQCTADSSNGNPVHFKLTFDDDTDGAIAHLNTGTQQAESITLMHRFETPTAASHTFKAAWKVLGGVTGTVFADGSASGTPTLQVMEIN